MNKDIGVYILFLFSLSVIGIPSSVAEMEHFTHVPADPNMFRFFVIGDWGREGLYRQADVANQMAEAASRIVFEFVLALGDNYYENGLTGEDDIMFTNSFTNVYIQESLKNLLWYAVLGNHDYHGNTSAQLSPALRQRDSRWRCYRSFVLTIGNVTIFFLDTTPMVDAYFGDKGRGRWENMPDRMEYISGQIKDLRSAMEKSKTAWKIVVGHHTMVSAGAHGATEDVVKLLEPILLEYDVDFYFNGHDHCLQKARKPNIQGRANKIQFVTSGGGSSAWVNQIHTLPLGQISDYYYDGEGFMMAEISKDDNNHHFSIMFVDINGNFIHGWMTSKQIS